MLSLAAAGGGGGGLAPTARLAVPFGERGAHDCWEFAWTFWLELEIQVQLE